LNNSGFTIIAFVLIAAVTVSAGGQAIQQPAADKSWPGHAYRVEWEETHTPTEVAARVTIAVPVTVRNSGNRIWPASEVFVAYHWLRDGRLIVWDGERTPFPRDLRAGSRAALSVRVATPTEPGSYVLQLTLVHEHVTWFEHKGATMIIRPVVVRPPTQSGDCGNSGSTPCTAAH
jgi:hypothetical protein